jgi:hypothetical protein
MAYSIQELIKTIDPTRTVLFFGAGSSVPSGAPSAADLAQAIRLKFEIQNQALGLADVASLAEKKTNRKQLVAFVRSNFLRLHVTGGLSTLPLYEWKSIYTTNYDKLIEEAYDKSRLTILREANELAQASIARYNPNRTVHVANCEVALAWFELTDDFSLFVEAVQNFKQAEQKFADPEMTSAIRRIERKASAVQSAHERHRVAQPTL